MVSVHKLRGVLDSAAQGHSSITAASGYCRYVNSPVIDVQGSLFLCSHVLRIGVTCVRRL
jgi:hypothetical protein